MTETAFTIDPEIADLCRELLHPARRGGDDHDGRCVMGPYELDVVPTRKQVRVLQQVLEGDRILLAIGGRGYRWERAGGSVPAYLVKSLINNRWVEEPLYPLLGPATAGGIPERGRHAVDRYFGVPIPLSEEVFDG
jgi:hypothetical protein